MRVNEIPVRQAAAAKVTRPLPSFAEQGVATRDYSTEGVATRDYSTEGVALRMRICTAIQKLSRKWVQKKNKSMRWPKCPDVFFSPSRSSHRK